MSTTYVHMSRSVLPRRVLPRALREQVWLSVAGKVYETKCHVPWCANVMTAFDFHVGHDRPASKGGADTLDNLRPICSRCNLSMGAQYSIQEWARLVRPGSPGLFCCFGKK